MTALYCDAYTLGARYFIVSIDSISSPFSDDWRVVISDIPDVIGLSTPFCEYDKLPENVKFELPFPSFPFVIIYVAVIVLPFSGFFPKILSPNKSWYFSSSTSCIKNIFEFSYVPRFIFDGIPYLLIFSQT